MSIHTLQNQLVRVCLPWRLGKTGMMSRCLRRCPVSPLIGPHFVQEMPKIFSLTHRNSSLRKPGLFLQWLFYGHNGLPRWHSSKESTCQCRRHERLSLIPGLGGSPGVGNGNPTPVILPGEFHGWRSLAGYSHGVAKHAGMVITLLSIHALQFTI